ncbi:MAG: aminopeptidase P family protein [Saprospiraceae bacterium]|nr:aminopeptidase P family protein [Saprospiraceae bacterium]
MRFTLITSLLLSVLLYHPLSAQSSLPGILSERDRATIVDEILEDRIDNLLPELMRREGVDMWVLISREYNEDPVMKTMLPSTWLNARRRTIMVYHDRGPEEGVEKLAIARYAVGRLLQGSWDIDVYPDQWEALVQAIKDRNPSKIALNISQDFGLADGLVHTEYEAFHEKLPAQYHDRLVSAERLAIAWLETRSQKELEIYPMICRLGHTILQEGLSERVIHPGITTTDDVVWWLRQRVTELGLDTWFHPTVSIQRYDPENFDHLRTFSKRPDRRVIQFGDLLHVDFGITYLRLNSDQQQHFYVLHPDEKEVPASLSNAFEKGKRLQDILISQFEKGKSGNQVLQDALEQAEKENIVASIYTHPIGSHGHAAGPTIGMWDKQGGVKGTGDYPLFYNTAYSIELNASSEIAEWGKIVRIMLEEDGYFDADGFHWLDNRQEEILTIPRSR